MNRKELEAYLLETYNTEVDHPWAEDPSYAVFRHTNNRKWFALVMNIPRARLGLPGEESIDVVNVKCDPLQIGAFRQQAGVYPGYHMNKDHWLSLALDGTLDDDTLKLLLDISYELTAPKAKKCQKAAEKPKE